jgi:molybdenum cofactor cytidylyltransferase
VSNYPFSIVIPAAGASRRLGQSKQLVQLNGQTLLERAVRNAATLPADEIIVITGSGADSLPTEVQLNSNSRIPVRLRQNPDWVQGMGSSISLGARSIRDSSRGLMILLCDQWRIDSADLRKLTDAWITEPTSMVVSECGGITGPPAIFPDSCFDSLRQLKGDTGARGILKKHTGLLRRITIPNAAADLDTPADLIELAKFVNKI